MGSAIHSWVTGVVYLLAATAAHGATIAVPAGGDLQAALDAAQPGDVITLGANDSTQTIDHGPDDQVPYAFILDRLYVHGDPELGQKRGIALHSRDTTIVNSWVSDCKAIGQEAQAIGGFNGPGNYVIENNYLEGSTQSFLLGGADPPIQGLVTTAVVFRHNHLSKPLVAYHLWVRGKADRDKRVNDAVMVQFSGSVDAAGAPAYRIGTTLATDVNLADCNGCHLSGWGWQDNGWGRNVVGPAIYFEQPGAQTIRVQVKEDGFSIDQIVLSAETFLTVAPGALKNDTMIVPRD